MFKSYEALRTKWSLLDCYQSPGPIQFKGAGSDGVNFMVRPPDLDSMIYETDVQERYESRHLHEDMLFKQESSLSELSRARIKAHVPIPGFLRKGTYSLMAIKKYYAESPLVNMKIKDQLPLMRNNIPSQYFVELQNEALDDIGTSHNQQKDGRIDYLNK